MDTWETNGSFAALIDCITNIAGPSLFAASYMSNKAPKEEFDQN